MKKKSMFLGSSLKRTEIKKINGGTYVFKNGKKLEVSAGCSSSDCAAGYCCCSADIWECCSCSI
ncbi:MAG: hypothetical protein QM528_00005 [Phycisphaerales bacterium]|nr:hypothetical protein [Phycisphaerales bacterium]